MAGTLYVVPTPIGNMSDITARAKETLEKVHFIAAEDTRVSGRLLQLLDIHSTLVSYHEHNKEKSGKAIVNRILDGEDCALVTDAGTPAVSDPGEDLVRKCRKAGINVVALPGPCAAITALSASGMPSRRFSFEGFLPQSNKEREEYLRSVCKDTRTMIFHVSPHDTEKDLTDLIAYLGDREAVLAKEITKINEKYFSLSLSEIKEGFKSGEINPKGEFVLIVHGYEADETDMFWADMTVTQHFEYYVKMGLSKMDATKAVAKDRGVPKNEIYKELN
ncbi:MAG: 16S rRNA (cytidine(1402)-2'-O)-methyltransferase [Clostridia bacterium]|nr:16S rRNA (cytidine(1402)-2'-O)-methyltransferase [Clostridia bacterium]